MVYGVSRSVLAEKNCNIRFLQGKSFNTREITKDIVNNEKDVFLGLQDILQTNNIIWGGNK